MSKPTIEDQIYAELEDLARNYGPIPEGAKTIAQLREKYPDMPPTPLYEWVNKRVKSGEWKRARRGNTIFFWPAKS